MKSFLIALQFLTRIPVRFKEIPTDKQTANSLLYYPLVGLFIGLLLYALNNLLSDVSELLRAAIVLTSWIIITGALHLDGLADSADALVGGYGDKEKTLAIMKDPYCGPVGVTTLVVVLLLKFALIASLNDNSILLLILAPVLARSSMIGSFLSTPYVRQQGLGSAMANHFSRKAGTMVLTTIILLTIFIAGSSALMLIPGLLIIFYGLRKLMLLRIGGMTGDTLGAQLEIVEVLVLLLGVLWVV